MSKHYKNKSYKPEHNDAAGDFLNNQDSVNQSSSNDEDSDYQDQHKGSNKKISPKNAKQYNYINDVNVDLKRRSGRVKLKKLYPDLSDDFDSENLNETDSLYTTPTKRNCAKVNKLHSNFVSCILIAIFLLVALCFCLYIVKNSPIIMHSQTINKTLREINLDMKQHLKMLHQDISQSKQFWSQVISQVELITEEEPLQPAVLLVIVPTDGKKSAACISQNILEIVSKSFQDSKYITFDTLSHIGYSAVWLKHQLDSLLQELLTKHAAGFFNIEKLDPEATMIFHSYCDHENAPFKRAFILLTFETDLPHDSLISGRLEPVVYDTLMNILTRKLREVDAAALVSRITNAPLIIKPEDDYVIDKICPV